MNIVVDENIPFGKEAFSTLGSVTVLPGRHMTREHLREASVLIVRSVTQVNETLLAETDVRFVGTATAGIDHIDQHYLAQRNIGFADAAGSNANSVAEYVLTALIMVASRFKISLEGKTLGIVGVGRIGSRVANLARALGMEVILNDPPLARETGDRSYRSLQEALSADFVTFHVPLIKEGIDKTYHLIGEQELSRMSPSSVLMNTSRGEVINNLALHHSIQKNSLQGVILDVWEGEPFINWELANFLTLGTPHIAGYSLDGKINGTTMIYQAACQFFGMKPTWQTPSGVGQSLSADLIMDATASEFQDLVHILATRLYDLSGDNARLRSLLSLPPSDRPAGFDQLRKNYPTRREFSISSVGLKNANISLIRRLQQLGFSTYLVEN